jgi:hypothetical protein
VVIEIELPWFYRLGLGVGLIKPSRKEPSLVRSFKDSDENT